MDIYLPDVKVIIEQKAPTVSLDSTTKHSGKDITPFEQARDYNNSLRLDKKAKYIITSNFKEIRIYDMNAEDTDNPPFQLITLEEFAEE